MKINLFDGSRHNQLLPFTHTRPVADIRCGILTGRERWQMLLNAETGTLTEDYLSAVFPKIEAPGVLYVNAAIVATKELADAAANLKSGEKLVWEQHLVAFYGETSVTHLEEEKAAEKLAPVYFPGSLIVIQRIWDIFKNNEAAICIDVDIIAKGRQSQLIPEFVTAIHPENIFMEPGAKAFPCILNAEKGPIYIGAEAEVMEGATIRGPFALGEHAVVKMGTKIYGGTTIGPGCKVGGEISNAVFFANSNKGHDGFVGNAVIGEWCNLGADTNCSNLKNNYDEIKIWDERQNKSVKTGLQFCGLMMGDHSKCGINTMFNTGTVVGVSCNIYGGGFPEKFIPSFTWGGSEGLATYRLDKALATADRMMERRNKQLSHEDKTLLQAVFDNTANQRDLMGAKAE
ncbi:MAG: GlmU family protein [Edaphocola sp.]